MTCCIVWCVHWRESVLLVFLVSGCCKLMRTVEVCRWEGPVVLAAVDGGGRGWLFLDAIEEKASWVLPEVVFLECPMGHAGFGERLLLGFSQVVAHGYRDLSPGPSKLKVSAVINRRLKRTLDTKILLELYRKTYLALGWKCPLPGAEYVPVGTISALKLSPSWTISALKLSRNCPGQKKSRIFYGHFQRWFCPAERQFQPKSGTFSAFSAENVPKL